MEFIVLHYTAQSLKKSLDIFISNSDHPVSCHFLIDEEGKIYKLLNCWDGFCKKAFHAGDSYFVDSKKKVWEHFNDFSIG